METRSLIVALGATLLLLGLAITSGNTALAKTQEKSDSKDMESSFVTSQETQILTIPPIDAAAPSSFETASFGLG